MPLQPRITTAPFGMLADGRTGLTLTYIGADGEQG